VSNCFVSSYPTATTQWDSTKGSARVGIRMIPRGAVHQCKFIGMENRNGTRHAVQTNKPDHDKVDGNDVVQQARHRPITIESCSNKRRELYDCQLKSLIQ
jgi:hypothetical protein